MEMYAYIDEAGDDGTGGKGTKWFIMAALIANQEDATALGNVYQSIRQRINLQVNKPIHWSELTHLRKKAVTEELINPNFSICSVLVDTQHPDIVNTSPKLNGRRLYFYTFRDCRKKPVQTMICYSGDAGFVKNLSCPLYQVIITSFLRVVLLLFGPVPRRLTG